MASVVHLTDSNFDAEVLGAKGTVLVDFGAEWCGPCKQLDPIVKELAGEFDGKAKLCKVDIGASQQLAMRFQIMSVPTIIIFRNGRPAAQINGLAPKKDIAKAITKTITDAL